MKKKSFLAVPLSFALAFSLTACSANEASETSQESESVSESEVESEVESENTETSSSTSGAADISAAIDGSTTSDESAASFGQWVAVTNYAAADRTYHTIYVRATKITAYSEDEAYIQEAIDLNNENSSDWNQVDLDDYTLPDDAEWYVLDYEVYIPEDFPSSNDDGSISEPSMLLSTYNIGGGGIPSNDGETVYIGLSSNKIDLEVYASDVTFVTGNTYTFKMLFAMVTGYEDYVFRMSTYYDGTTSDETSVDTMYYAYFASR